MAFVTIRNVNVVNTNSKGFTAVEVYERNGEEFKTYYKVWTEEAVPAGSLNISGILSVRVSEYDGKVRAEIHVNKPRIESAGDAPVAKPAGSVSWGNPAPIEIDNAPF
jgi:hypothetical protein